MPPRKKIDYDRLEAGWRLGVKSPRQMAEEYTAETGVVLSHAAIVNHFKRAGIERDLTAKVNAKAEAIVTRSLVTQKVTEPLLGEKELVEGVAELKAGVQLSHRRDIGRYKNLVAKLFNEVESATVTEGQEPPSEILSIPQRVDCVRKLTDSAKTLIWLEREAWGITNDAGAQSGKSFAEAIQDALGFGTIKLPSQERGNK